MISIILIIDDIYQFLCVYERSKHFLTISYVHLDHLQMTRVYTLFDLNFALSCPIGKLYHHCSNGCKDVPGLCSLYA